jgi:hypothetical protein
VVVTLLERISDDGRFQGDYVKLARWYESKILGTEQKIYLNTQFSTYIFDGDVKKACDWLLSLDDSVATGADAHAIWHFNRRDADRDKGLALLESLRAKSPERHQAAFVEFVFSYTSANPEACFEWTLGLPSNTLRRTDIIRNVFANVAVNDPKAAQARLNQVTDPALKAELAQVYREMMDILSKRAQGK